VFASCLVRLFFGAASVGSEQDTNKERTASEAAPNKPCLGALQKQPFEKGFADSMNEATACKHLQKKATK